jgi:hypothetical protein
MEFGPGKQEYEKRKYLYNMFLFKYLEASKCVERIARLKLFSYCGYLEKKARKKIEENIKKIQNVKLPAVIAKLEEKLKMKIGKTVSVFMLMKDYVDII